MTVASDDRDDAFEEHPSVPDRAHVPLPVDLLRSRSRADEPVKARAGPARDRDEERRDERQAVRGLPADEAGRLGRVASEEEADEARPEEDVEQDPAQEAPRLQEQPHGATLSREGREG
jgi:hypothetical protein